MDISVVVPIYKVEKYIEKCLRSLFDQTKTDGVEFILVNDCTPDNSMDVVYRIVEEYPNLTVKILSHEENKGLPSARQTGIDAASGDYIIHIDSDDWCELTMLEDMYNTAISNNSDIVCCGIYENTSNDESIMEQANIPEDGIECAKLCILFLIMPMVFNKLVKRSLYVENNIKTIKDITLGEDYVLMSRLFICANKVSYLPAAYYHYFRNNTSSITANRTYDNLVEERVKIINVTEEFIESRNLASVFHETLVRIKLRNKLLICISKNNRLIRDYANVFPEVNKYIESASFLTRRNKFLLSQAARNRVFLLYVYNYISSIRNLFRPNK